MDVEGGDVKIDVNFIVNSLRDRVGEQNAINKFPAYIRKAPSTLRKHSESSFTPRVVSIGPLHSKDKKLQRFEVRKAAFVHDLLSGRPLALTASVKKVASKIWNIRTYYDALKDYNDNILAEMMVMDACFIISFIHFTNKYSTGSFLSLQGQEQYIPYDLVLLENQIPFFVLEDIYECLTYPYKKIPLHITEFLLPLVKYVNVFEEQVKVSGDDIRSNTKIDHILGYLHYYYRPIKDIRSAFPSSTIHSAVELDRAGVNFKPNYDPLWPMAMEVKLNRSKIFWYLRMPTLKMPTLEIRDSTELVFRNLIAYEQSYVTNPYVTSYARAMNMLINTDEDIAMLVRSKVIVNHIGTNEAARDMIKRICMLVGLQEHFYYTKQFQELDKHFKNYCPRKTAKLTHECLKLKRTYFSSPWSIIALFAGINLFVLTWVQTIYTVKSSK